MPEVFLLSIVQGVTEFLPVSSSSHTILISSFFHYNIYNLLLDVSLHIGSFLAITFYFRNEIINISKNKKIFSLILLSSLPILIFGYILSRLEMQNILRSIEIIGWTTILFGILLLISDRFPQKKNINKNLKLSDVFIIGLLHSVALIPGVSRSGIAITASRFLGYSRLESTKLSFFLSIPTLFMVTVYGLYKISSSENLSLENLNIQSMIISFLFSYITIKYFLIFIKRFSLKSFVLYRLLIGSIIIFYVYF
tara:strand:+ start:21 stop:779 length:759 start_codon:yes stop_codon:yes gene_type:complete